MGEIAEILKAGQPYIKEPALVGLFILTVIIGYQFRALKVKDALIEKMIDSTTQRAETLTKLTTLVETLVNRGASGGRP